MNKVLPVPLRQGSVYVCVCATIKGDIINANKALRKTNMLTERTHLGGPYSQLPNGPNKNNMKESDTLCIRRLHLTHGGTPHKLACRKNYACPVISRREEVH